MSSPFQLLVLMAIGGLRLHDNQPSDRDSSSRGLCHLFVSARVEIPYLCRTPESCSILLRQIVLADARAMSVSNEVAAGLELNLCT